MANAMMSNIASRNGFPTHNSTGRRCRFRTLLRDVKAGILIRVSGRDLGIGPF
jgi:hypothetical protein